ncbi:MAG: winged helix-turn-helix domain-containing protein [Solirubrobacterales bacterium]|nr:winged helix-turn-helix domain-containing protein [Solirubrobacterales bacterium]MBV9166782.1 winged helix-turn-helix domain-containing protein [Solirubrobacterales bacterium]MBV9534990.1 winged helix-turn-helix domain-containing protein [Solirubrobacterales bacterium]
MSLLDEARAVRERIAARLRELEPLVEEYNELRRVAAEMGLEAAQAPRQPRARSTARQAAAARPAGAAVGGTDDLGARVLDAVRADPGMTVAEYARALDVSAATLYRPVRELANDGLIARRARHLFPA